MDGNKDDALKSLKIGKQALNAGDRARALKYLTKARRLDPTLSIDSLLSEAAGTESDDQPAPKSSNSFHDHPGYSPSKPSDQGSIHQRTRSTQSAATIQLQGSDFGMPGMGARTEDQGCTGFNIHTLILLLSVLLILLLKFLPSSSEPVYSLSRSYPYKYKFTTQKGVNYFVRLRKFEQDYPVNSHERIKIEESVEGEYYSVLEQQCRIELLWQQRVDLRETPHCDLLRKFQSAA